MKNNQLLCGFKPSLRQSIRLLGGGVFFLVLACGCSRVSSTTATDDPYAFARSSDGKIYQVQRNEHWQPITHHYDVEAGSILDFSIFLDPPAGKYGKLIVRNGHFEFQGRPGTRVKFYGNQVGLEGITKPECEKLAERFARMGYNNARIHVYDQDLASKTPPSSDLDPEQLDVLDYLFYCMKERGIYLSIDLYVARVLTDGEITEFPRKMQHEFKFLAHFTESGHENWKKFAGNLLNHVNPYTKLAWKDDPALGTISLINEDTPYHQMSMFPLVWETVLQPLYRKWAEQRGSKAVDQTEDIRRFLTEGFINSYKRKMRFLRELGIQQPLSGVSFMNHVYLSLIRDHLDFVDDHCYYDHPVAVDNGPMVSAPLKYRMKLNEQDFASLPRVSIACRIVGKPVSLSEFGQVYPNAYRSSSGMITAGYAALQDWDSLHRLKYASTPYDLDEGVKAPNGYTGNVFAIANDPMALLSDKAGILLFLRNEVKPGKNLFAMAVTDKSLEPLAAEREEKLELLFRLGKGSYPDGFQNLGLISRVGTIIPDQPFKTQVPYTALLVDDRFSGPLPASVLRQVPYGDDPIRSLAQHGYLSNTVADQAAQGIFASDQGQMKLDTRRGSFEIVTEMAEGFSGQGGLSWAGQMAKVTNGKGYATFFLGAMDGRPLEKSGRLLLLYLTDVLAEGTQFGNAERTLYVNHGKLPHLIRADQGTITIRNGDFQNTEVWAVDLAGRRVRKIETRQQEGNTTFTVSTTMACVYEVLRTPPAQAGISY